MSLRFLAALLALALVPAICSGAEIYYFVTTAHVGAQVQLDVNHTSTWTFTPVNDILFGGGKFILKDGSQTRNQLPENGTTLTIWDVNTPTPPLFTKTLTNAEFVTAKRPENDQSFGTTQVPYLVSGTATLLSGHHYTIKLTSPVADTANTQYFIKNPNTAMFVDGSGNPLPNNPPTITYDGPPLVPEVPEPGAALLMTSGLALIALGFRRRY